MAGAVRDAIEDAFKRIMHAWQAERQALIDAYEQKIRALEEQLALNQERPASLVTVIISDDEDEYDKSSMMSDNADSLGPSDFGLSQSATENGEVPSTFDDCRQAATESPPNNKPILQKNLFSPKPQALVTSEKGNPTASALLITAPRLEKRGSHGQSCPCCVRVSNLCIY